MDWRRGLLLALFCATIACSAAPHAGTWRGSLANVPSGGRRRLAAGTGRCPPPSREVLAARAKDNTLMFAVMNKQQWDFGRNWLHHVKKAGIGYYIAVAADVLTSEALAAAGEPCVERIDTEAAPLGLAWGQEGWRRVTWSKVFFLDSVADWGFNWVVSDADVVWFRDPAPLFAKHPAADLLFSEDGGQSRNEKGDDGIERAGSVYYNFNTGAYLLRGGANTTAFVHAWAKFYDECHEHDQLCVYRLMQTKDEEPEPAERGLMRGWHKRVAMGILPTSMFMSAHTLQLQRLNEVKAVPAYEVHMTWTYQSHPGKRARLRDMGLWAVDPPEYYQGSFVTVDLFGTPELPPRYNEWNENEDMISFHLEALHQQLQQAYVGMALAVAANRSFILPPFKCFCDRIWYSVVRCRLVDAQSMPFPVPCPQDYLFDPTKYDDPAPPAPPLRIREAAFLASERTPADVKSSVLVIRPSAALACSDCVQEAAGADGTPVLEVPPGLTDAQLLPLLEPYRRYRVWRLSLEAVGGPQRAFGGFADAAAAAGFDQRMERITGQWCCRREEELVRYHKQDQQAVKLRMNSQFKYSDMAAGRSTT